MMKQRIQVTQVLKEVFKSRKGDISWSSGPHDIQCRAPTENMIKMTPGLTRYAALHAQDIKENFSGGAEEVSGKSPL